jgi:hypothetical protein
MINVSSPCLWPLAANDCTSQFVEVVLSKLLGVLQAANGSVHFGC